MLIPNGPREVPTVSVSMLRSYGVQGFDVGLHEESRGCPRQFKHRYVLRDAPKDRAEVLVYGTVIHAAFEYMEEHSCSPEDALAACWEISLGPDRYAEALTDLREYLERPADIASTAVLASEVKLDALLFESDAGPVYLRGTVDRVEIDTQDGFLLHVRDFKTNRTPPSLEDVRADAQGKAYSWLVLQNLELFGFQPFDPRVKVIFHLDAIKWRELPPVFFNDFDLEAWHAWMVAIIRHIQADEQGLPIINPGCATCPVRDSCPAFKALPQIGSAEVDELKDLLGVDSADKAVLAAALANVQPGDRDALVVWRESANAVRLLLDKAVKEIDGRLKSDAIREGGLTAGGFTLRSEQDWRNTTDAERLHTELGDRRFYGLVSGEISVAALEREVAGDEPSFRARVLDCKQRVLVGTKITREAARRST